MDANDNGVMPNPRVTTGPRLRQVCEQILLDSPQVRSLAVAISFFDDDGTKPIDKLIWMGTRLDGTIGPVVDPPAVMNDMHNVLDLFGAMMLRAAELRRAWENSAVAIGKELVNKHEELQALEAKLREARAAIEKAKAPREPFRVPGTHEDL